MKTILEPRDEQELVQSIATASSSRTPLAIAGGNSKSAIGRPSQAAMSLSTKRIAGISLYEPTELVIGAKAGTPLSEVERTLAERGQMLPFEPMDYRPLLGDTNEATLGGIAAANISGPRRILAGACRDSLIGVRLANGRGEIVKSGGRVMKNVTGLDLVKLTCGSWGTLGVFTEVIFKVVPKPECSSSLVLRGLDDSTGIAALSAALGSPFEVSAAAHIPGKVASESVTVVRLEGFSASVAYRLREIAKIWKAHGTANVLDEKASVEFWCSARDARALGAPADAAVWRLSLAPSKASDVVTRIGRAIGTRHFYDWGGGLVWLAVDAAGDAGAATIRGAMQGCGGHATLVRAPYIVRATLDVYEPLPPSLWKLTAGLKSTFDPNRILNPGRMYAGI
ncbi:glycolate oxidase subunit GlcE [Bradyrhizobium sp. BR13661]|jgi:glycolate oxidase FAD binding subunit|uniref:glycolate oxidase subunit GlcE n=1 Tax=Bradyrhizobium sp. BR13661 TaxID=2940622 RepID=UPI00247460FC|nr:glycolate oxidase subunit GlcE [Bradyrhizobium sp. BR13661]MDH6257568.1 glycolate oxidase FAD binding subunit [Bradyrhizobium sp. BR13661]